jgi:hypothetical protein
LNFKGGWAKPLSTKLSGGGAHLALTDSCDAQTDGGEAVRAALWLERFKKYCSQFGAEIFGFWRGFGEGAGLKNPVTEPKRCQKPKRPLSLFSSPNGYSIF